MAGMTKVDHDTALASGFVGQGVACDTLTGAGVDLTEIAAAVAGVQHHVIGGEIAAEGAGHWRIYSKTTKIAVVECAAGALTQPFPRCWTATGEALQIENFDGVAAIVRCVSVPITAGKHCPYVLP